MRKTREIKRPKKDCSVTLLIRPTFATTYFQNTLGFGACLARDLAQYKPRACFEPRYFEQVDAEGGLIMILIISSQHIRFCICKVAERVLDETVEFLE